MIRVKFEPHFQLLIMMIFYDFSPTEFLSVRFIVRQEDSKLRVQYSWHTAYNSAYNRNRNYRSNASFKQFLQQPRRFFLYNNLLPKSTSLWTVIRVKLTARILVAFSDLEMPFAEARRKKLQRTNYWEKNDACRRFPFNYYNCLSTIVPWMRTRTVCSSEVPNNSPTLSPWQPHYTSNLLNTWLTKLVSSLLNQSISRCIVYFIYLICKWWATWTIITTDLPVLWNKMSCWLERIFLWK